MTGTMKTLIALTVVLALVATILITYLVTQRILPKATADQPPTLTQSNITSSTQSETTTTASSEKIVLPLIKGWNLKTLPYTFSPNDGLTVFSKLSTQDAFYLDPDKQVYSSFLDGGNIVPGRGFWVRSESGEVLEPVANSSQAVDETREFSMNLKKGWNLIGNPFTKDIFWNPSVQTETRKLTLQQAIDERVVTASYSWSPSGDAYVEVKPGQTLKKFQGVLIKSGGPVKLTLTSE